MPGWRLAPRGTTIKAVLRPRPHKRGRFSNFRPTVLVFSSIQLDLALSFRVGSVLKRPRRLAAASLQENDPFRPFYLLCNYMFVVILITPLMSPFLRHFAASTRTLSCIMERSHSG